MSSPLHPVLAPGQLEKLPAGQTRASLPSESACVLGTLSMAQPRQAPGPLPSAHVSSCPSPLSTCRSFPFQGMKGSPVLRPLRADTAWLPACLPGTYAGAGGACQAQPPAALTVSPSAGRDMAACKMHIQAPCRKMVENFRGRPQNMRASPGPPELEALWAVWVQRGPEANARWHLCPRSSEFQGHFILYCLACLHDATGTWE